ncbi:hypothetical protein ACHAW6_011765 [Cyclotella cf. meneghiniana]
MKIATSTSLLISLLVALTLPFTIFALVEPDRTNSIAYNSFVHPALSSDTEFVPLASVQALIDNEDQTGWINESDISLLDVQVDVRSGRIASIPLNEPIYPGDNPLLWRIAPLDYDDHEDENNVTDQYYSYMAIQGVKQWLTQHQDELSISVSELFAEGSVRTAVHDNGNLIQVNMGRSYNNLTVVDSRAFATVKRGNLVNIGFEKWGSLNLGLDFTPTLTLDEAKNKLADWSGADLASPRTGLGDKENKDLCEPKLQILTLAHDDTRKRKRVPKNMTVSAETKFYYHKEMGYKHILAWRVCPVFENQQREIMEGLIDAQTGEVYSFIDKIDYFTGTGSVYPLSNDGKGPDGMSQPGWPMPFLQIKDVNSGALVMTDTGGNFFSSGENTIGFRGQYVLMADVCGEAGMTVQGNFDWGSSSGTDCKTPGYGGKGNTHASRSGYYELNKMMEIARSHLPSNEWLKLRLTANMNIKDSCNAFWDGSTINFFRSSGSCANTGEIAAVFDHEWGHGLDNNDVYPDIVMPSGEGIADIYSALRLGDSCIGRGFFSVPCTQSGDPCINNCTGVRDIDYDQHASGKPHTLTWTIENCDYFDVHCQGLVYAEAIWSLWKRDLPSLYGYDDNTALEIVMRLTFIAAGNVATWYSGGPPYGGCGGNSGYLSYLYADDDDGDITNGTPHMTAIYAAHNRQEIACKRPTVRDSGCLDTPQEAPTLNIVSGSMKNILMWTSVSNAIEYQVFRTEGVSKCAQGKVLLATVPSNTMNYTDTGLMNGRDYFYIVIPKGKDSACFGPASECIQAVPKEEPDYQVACQSEVVVIEMNPDCNGCITEPNTSAGICTVFPLGGYTGNVSLTCSAPGFSCSSSSPIMLSADDDYVNIQVNISITSSTSDGTHQIDVLASDESISRSAKISVIVFDMTMAQGYQEAVYNPNLGAPICYPKSKECSSGNLLIGRGNMGPEPNAPNALDDCPDGSAGIYKYDESVNKIVVRYGRINRQDSDQLITEEDYITIIATVWSFSPDDTADFWITSTPSDPSWNYIGSVHSRKEGKSEEIKIDFRLGKGLTQAVRVSFHYGALSTTLTPCLGGPFDDADDLVFAVHPSRNATTPTPSPQSKSSKKPTPMPNTPPTRRSSKGSKRVRYHSRGTT